jgi:hypothetical protein
MAALVGSSVLVVVAAEEGGADDVDVGAVT